MRVIEESTSRAGGSEAELPLIAALLPGFACAEAFGDLPESTMLEAEASVVAGASPKRRREFATGRHCARMALRRLGVFAGPILPDPDRAPRWPAGVVGSITHCTGYRAAAATRSVQARGIGIDAEPHAPLPDGVWDLVARDEEREQLLTLAATGTDVHWDRVLFCAKEATYKAWSPLGRRWLDFTDVTVTVDRAGTFRARVPASPLEAPLGAPEPLLVRGRWAVARGLIAAAAVVEGAHADDG